MSEQMEKNKDESRIISINGQVIKARGQAPFRMLEAVRVGSLGLIGEVIKVNSDAATIQVYEVTTGLRVSEPVFPTGKPLSITLGPGLVSNFFDGIQRPLSALEKASGPFIVRGIEVPNLDEKRLWSVKVLARAGDSVSGGTVIAEVLETPSILHKVLVPPEVSGEVTFAAPSGDYRINDVILRVRGRDGGLKTDETEVRLSQKWPIRRPRPIRERIPITVPLVTGQRVIDTFFPIGKGGTAAIPGSFGTGKTMAQHQIAKWSDADIIVYIGCGERGNEMTEVLEDFPKLVDPRTGRSLMERTILIANTSNMPVAAREASIYTGITIAEYYRDMGYSVAVMADSTSRWAEALREISGRLEEMPAEEGFPAYLSSRLSEFYERAGNVGTLGGGTGSITIIGAVSPQGGDFSEPVTQNTKRYIRCFWGLDRQLAYARHYPAINWITSYSEYIPDLTDWFSEHVDESFLKYRNELMSILLDESKLQDIVKLVGSDILADDQKLTLEIGSTIRLGFLQQAAFHPVDTFVPLEKQCRMMKLILFLYGKVQALVKSGVPMSEIKRTGVFETVVKVKFDIENERLDKFDALEAQITEAIGHLGA
ncbi:MAG: V-type ATP synthase subunit A [Clostridiales bacterium]|nr:V-type ATP synthase subunit A [Clostridiales bacterium]